MDNYIFVNIGYIFFDLVAANKSGEPNNFDIFLRKLTGKESHSKVIMRYHNKEIHIHHWMILTVIAIIMQNYPKIVYFCIGGILQGLLQYDDWCVITKTIST